VRPAGRIPPQDWMLRDDTRAVLAALQAEGTEVRFVGGCVRDALLGRPVKDVDIATPDPPEKVMALLRRAGLKAVPTGLEHGTVTAVSDHHPFEITTLREDVETYGRRARVAFTDDWTADAARRDFTMNAMFCAPDGTVYDPFEGWDDLLKGRVRFVGEPARRIQEDYLRLLRFFRFHAHYGQGAPDPDGLRAAARYAPHLAELSGERIREELFKLLSAPDPAPVLRVMADHRVLESVLPEARRVDRLAALVRWETVAEVAGDPLRRLAALLAATGEAVERIAWRLRLSNQEHKRLAVLVAPPLSLWPDTAGQPLRAALYRLGAARVRDLLLLAAASRTAAGGALAADALRQALAEAAAWTPRRLPVGGRDVQDLGVKKGPRVGELLRAVEDWWVEQDFHPDREACLTKLRKLIRST